MSALPTYLLSDCATIGKDGRLRVAGLDAVELASALCLLRLRIPLVIPRQFQPRDRNHRYTAGNRKPSFKAYAFANSRRSSSCWRNAGPSATRIPWRTSHSNLLIPWCRF